MPIHNIIRYFSHDKLLDWLLARVLKYFVLNYVIEKLYRWSAGCSRRIAATTARHTTEANHLSWVQLYEIELPYWLGIEAVGNWLCIGYMSHYQLERQLIDFCMPVARLLITSACFICYLLFVIAVVVVTGPRSLALLSLISARLSASHWVNLFILTNHNRYNKLQSALLLFLVFSYVIYPVKMVKKIGYAGVMFKIYIFFILSHLENIRRKTQHL